MMHPTRRRSTLDDFWTIPEEQRFHELIAGEIIPKTSPSVAHGSAQLLLGAAIQPFHRSSGGRGGPGGWWFASEAEILLEPDIVRPDIAGWRRDHYPQRPTGIPTRQRPDWICEIVSPSNATNDTVTKRQLYHRARISHYWLLDPDAATLTVMRWTADGFLSVLTAARGDTVRAEPFDQIELVVGTLFGDDPPDPAA